MPYRSSAAHPAPQPRREDRPWIFAGAVCLASVAGYVNVVVLAVFHVPVSHMSGAVSRLGIDMARGNGGDLGIVASIVGAFLLGAMLSGAVIGNRKLTPGRRYGLMLLLEGAVLLAATLLLQHARTGGVALAGLACGIQNAMASSYYGLVIRTTHVTGIVTDIGVMIGRRIRGRRVRTWKLALLLSILFSFFAGGVAGELMYRAVGIEALALAAGGCMAAGTGYAAWRHLSRRQEAS